MNITRSTFSALPPVESPPIRVAHEMIIKTSVDGACKSISVKSPVFKAHSDFEIIFTIEGAEASVLVRSKGVVSGLSETNTVLFINECHQGACKTKSRYGCVFYTSVDDVKKWISASRIVMRFEISERLIMNEEGASVSRRMLMPLKGTLLEKGAEVMYREKSGQDARKMRVISPGVPWQEPLVGSADVNQVRLCVCVKTHERCVSIHINHLGPQDDVRDRDALIKAWGCGFDPITMYTILCDTDWRPSTIVWILYFPDVPVQKALPVYIHRALRQMYTAGRENATIGKPARRKTTAGPADAHFDYTEFPAVAYARPKREPADGPEGAAGASKAETGEKKVKVETDA